MRKKDDLRLIARVAKLYYENHIKQNDIAEQLGISQAAISRLLTLGEKEGIVKVVVNVPRGVYTEMEEQLVQKFGMKDVVIADCASDEESPSMTREIGACAASYLENIIRPKDVIGLSSWSSLLLSTVNAMSPLSRKSDIKVVQILGGLGNASAQDQSAYLASHLASLVNGTAYFLPLPGVIKSDELYKTILQDKSISDVFAMFQHVNTALVGIGAISPSRLLAASGNVLSNKDFRILEKNGAVGDILLRFFDQNGRETDEKLLTSHVISMELSQLKQVERAIGIAGGKRKFRAILGSLRGKLINTLITDQFTAQRLLAEQ